jgi:hypothetical protein
MVGLVITSRVYPTCARQNLRNSGKPELRCHPRLKLTRQPKDVDARDKRGHDVGEGSIV